MRIEIINALPTFFGLAALLRGLVEKVPETIITWRIQQ